MFDPDRQPANPSPPPPIDRAADRAGGGSAYLLPQQPQAGLVPLFRFLYQHNPFYLISACLILAGLNATFGTGTDSADAWTLMGVLAGYALLMAGTALLIVRLGRVWEDARSILLIVVLLFLALSVSFDEIVGSADVGRQVLGRWLLFSGFALSVLVSEGLLHGLRIRLPALFRIPYYAMLLLFFGYPLVLQALVKRPGDPQRWGVFGFGVATAAVLLLLLPAIRRGRAYVKDTGTPWTWPWFPWLLFGLLTLSACVRSYYLSISFDPDHAMDSIFGLYFLAPVGFAAAVLLLEAGRVEGKRWMQGVALAIPLLALRISFTSSQGTPLELAFLSTFRKTFANPAFVAAIAAAMFYVYASLRGVRLAVQGLLVALLLTSAIRPKSPDAWVPVVPQAIPLAMAGLVLTWLAVRDRLSVYALLATAALVGACAVALRGTAFLVANGAIPLHLLLLATLAIAAAFGDRFARALQDLAALAMAALLLGTVTFWTDLSDAVPVALLWVYVPLMILIALTYGCWVRNIRYLYAALAGLGLATLHGLFFFYDQLDRVYEGKATLPFFGSGAAFVLAVIISLSKIRGAAHRLVAGVIALYRPRPWT